MSCVHAVIELRGDKVETLCGLEGDLQSQFGSNNQFLLFRSARARSMIEAVRPKSISEISCINCRCVWHRITQA